MKRLRKIGTALRLAIVCSLFMIAGSAFGQSLAYVSFSQNSVVGGGHVVATAFLNAPAPVQGWSIRITSQSGYVGAPPWITIPYGATSGTFKVTTETMSQTYTNVITATDSVTSKSATLTITPDPVVGVTLSQSSVTGGATLTGQVSIASPAPYGGAAVNLTSQAPQYASVPSGVTIPEGSTTATFSITTSLAPVSYSDLISATYGTTSKSVTLTLTGDAVSRVGLNPGSVIGGKTSTGTVFLSVTAPAGGWTVRLSSQYPSAATVPSSITIPAGSSSGSFTITTSSVAQLVSDIITASDNSSSNFNTLAVMGPQVPVVYYSSDPVFNNETVLASTGNTDANTTASIVQISDSAPGSPLQPVPALPTRISAQVLQASSTSVKFVVPASYTHGVYAYKLQNSLGLSATQLLNIPHVMFIQGDLGDAGTPGGWLEAHGANVGMAGQASILALVQNGQVTNYLTPSESDPYNDTYRQRFLLPSTVAPGTYQVYCHNGHGGGFGWSKYQTFVAGPVTTITIVNPPSWPSKTVNVAAPNGVDDDASVAAAIAAIPTGGTLQFPAGKYILNNPIVVPDQTVIQGAGSNGTTLTWATDPQSGGAYLPLISGSFLYWTTAGPPVDGSFSVNNINLVASSTYNGVGILRQWTQEPGVISNVSITMPLNGSSASTQASGIYLRQTNDTVITNCTVNARTAIYCREQVTNTRVENSVLEWREADIKLCGNSYNFIIEGNQFELLGNSATNNYSSNDNPGFWLTTANGYPNFSGAYTEDIYYGYNKSTHNTAFTAADAQIGSTYDSASGIYFGGIQSVQTQSGITTVNLTGSTSVISGSNYNYTGAVMKVESGTGAGQWAYITNATPGSTTVSINQPFAVPLDSTSVVSIVNMMGEAIFDSNNYGAEPCDQNYYFSMDVIKANNVYASATSEPVSYYGYWGGDLSVAGEHYNMPFSNWHFQFLNNTNSSGTTSFATMTTSPMPGYSGAVASYIVYRDNVDIGPGQSVYMLRAKAGQISDALIEGNQVQYVGLGNLGEPLNFQGVILRNNPGASYSCGNLAGINLEGISGVAYIP